MAAKKQYIPDDPWGDEYNLRYRVRVVIPGAALMHLITTELPVVKDGVWVFAYCAEAVEYGLSDRILTPVGANDAVVAYRKTNVADTLSENRDARNTL